MSLKFRKLIVKMRMWYADIRGHHGKRWDYEPGDHYMGMSKSKKNRNIHQNDSKVEHKGKNESK